MTQKELDILLDKHERWLFSNGTEGKRLDLRDTDLSGAVFSGRNLSMCSMFRCNLTGAKFDDTHMLHAHLTKSRMIECSLYGMYDVAYSDWRGVDLSRSTIRHVHFLHVDFTDARICEAHIQAGFFDCTMNYTQLCACTIEGVGFDTVGMYKAKFTDSTIRDSSFKRVNLQGVDISGACFADNMFRNSLLSKEIVPMLLRDRYTEYIDCRQPPPRGENNQMSQEELDFLIEAHKSWMKNPRDTGIQLELWEENLTGLDFNAAILSHVIMHDCRLADAKMAHTIWRDSWFDRSYFRGTDLTKTNFDNCTFFWCTLDDADVRGSLFTQTVLDQSLVQYSTFSNSTFSKCIFSMHSNEGWYDSSSFVDASFLDCTLSLPHLENCDFSGARMTNTVFANCGLKDTIFTGAVSLPTFANCTDEVQNKINCGTRTSFLGNNEYPDLSALERILNT